ncbi:MAG: choice-of-anchor D domain-containing protein, partial [Deltaproteobacteria bacterium]|nr:choice-of-anchor D domain-containing protein [Deltaproteobacteria bacterium]
TSPATSFTFAATQVGSTSAPTSITVRPGGLASSESYDDVTAVSAPCPDFVVNAFYLPAPVYRTVICDDTCGGGGICQTQLAAPLCYTDEYVTYSFDAAFRPTVAGDSSCVVTITTNGATTRTITLFGSGSVPPIDIDVQPTSVAFGDVRRGTASTATTVSVRNLGGSALTVTGATITGAFVITSGPTAGTTIQPGATQPYTVTCNPTAVGGSSGALTITSNDPATPSVNVPVSCNGIDSNLDITPSPSTIPTTRVGEPQLAALTLRNSGAAAMTINSVVLSGTDITMVTAPPAGTVLGAGLSTPLQVRFGATASGDAVGMAVVTYDGGQVRSVPIAARALNTSMAMTPDGAVDLGPVCIGQTKDQEFSIIANDQGPFQINEVIAPDAPFEVKGVPVLPIPVQGAGATKVRFVMTAAPTTAGPSTSSMTIKTDIPAALPREIALSVEGLPAGLTGTPALLDFGSTPTEVTTLGENVQVTNCSTAPAVLMNARLEGPDASEFAIVLPPTSSTIPASGTASWLVVMAARATGIKNATFIVDGPDGPVSVELTGEGLGDVGPDLTGERTPSYYACSAAGSATSAWPLAVVLALVFRRRRRQGATARAAG